MAISGDFGPSSAGRTRASLSSMDWHWRAPCWLTLSGARPTKDLQGMMSYNRLHLADRVRLLRGEPIFFD